MWYDYVLLIPIIPIAVLFTAYVVELTVYLITGRVL